LTSTEILSILADVRSVTTRLAALAAIVTLSMSAWVQCAGWQSSAETRMACCDDEEHCPMHSAGNQPAPVRPAVTQSQADACCGLSEHSSTTPSRSSFVPAADLVAVTSPTAADLPAAPHVRHDGRAFTAHPLGPVRRHLLLSVLLV
jgi:hypothetical protein